MKYITQTDINPKQKAGRAPLSRPARPRRSGRNQGRQGLKLRWPGAPVYVWHELWAISLRSNSFITKYNIRGLRSGRGRNKSENFNPLRSVIIPRWRLLTSTKFVLSVGRRGPFKNRPLDFKTPSRELYLLRHTTRREVLSGLIHALLRWNFLIQKKPKDARPATPLPALGRYTKISTQAV